MTLQQLNQLINDCELSAVENFDRGAVIDALKAYAQLRIDATPPTKEPPWCQICGVTVLGVYCDTCHSILTAPDPAKDGPAPPPTEPATGRSEWQPIATAPKDGTDVLLWWFIEPTNRHVVAVGLWHAGLYAWAIRDGFCTGQPTHWQPLPAAPVSPATKDGQDA